MRHSYIIILCVFFSVIADTGASAQSRSSWSDYNTEVQRARRFSDDFGQTVEEASVLKRSRPQYDPIGGRSGGFIYYPYATASVLFDDNIFAATTEQDDVIFKSAAGLKVESDWGRNYLGFQFDVENYSYDQFESEDHTNLAGLVKGRLDIYHNTRLYGLFAVNRSHENRGAGSALASTVAAEPTPYTAIKGASYLERNLGRVNFQINGSVEHFNYDDVAAVGGGLVDQDARDGFIYKVGLRKSYNFSPGYNLFGMVEGNFRDFKGGGGAPNRDSEGIETRVGVEFEVTRLIAGELSFGYLSQDYENAAFSGVDDLAYRAALKWNPTRLMTVNFSASRVVSETTVANASGRLDSKVNSSIDYEILRNLIGTVHGEYLFEDYEGITREDETVVTGVSVMYLINRRLRAKAYYTYQKRDSTTATFDYEKNIFGSELKIQF